MLNEEQITEIIREEESNYRTAEQLADRFCADESERGEFFAVLGRCLERGLLALTKKGKYVLPERLGLLRGRIQGNRKGFAFLIRDDGERPDLFVAPGNLHGALHGDHVLARVIPDGRDECEVVLVAERAQKPVVGVFAAERGYGYVVPFDKKANFDLFIPSDRAGEARDGDTVVARIDRYFEDARCPEGYIEEVLGRDDRESRILSVIRSHDLREEFPVKVQRAAEEVPSEPTEEDFVGREDFRALTAVTIDGEDSKDLDDAVSLEDLPNGGYLLGVHIADVAHYVREGSPIDREAFERGTSVYFPDRVYPMLPRELSNGICSLNGGANRLTLSCMIEFDATGEVLSSRLAEGVICTAARMTYTDVSAILEGDEFARARYGSLVPLFERMERLARLLIAKREKRGAVDLDVPEFKVILDENNEISEIVPYPRKMANRMIEEFMIAANECVAESLFYCELPFLYRVHEQPLAERVETFADFVQGLGFRLKCNPERITPRAYSKLLDELKDQPVRSLVNRVMLRTMCKAKYSPQESGHFGLSAKYYCHFTSPIRRYPDLFIHRVIKAMLHGNVDGEEIERWSKNVEAVARHCSERERVADEAERDVDDYYKAEYMYKHLGDSYLGIVSGVKDFGLFVELPNTIEGVLRRESLPDDDYVFEERRFALIGRGHVYRLGDEVEVTVAAADAFSGRVEFVLPEPSEQSEDAAEEDVSDRYSKARGRFGASRTQANGKNRGKGSFEGFSKGRKRGKSSFGGPSKRKRYGSSEGIFEDENRGEGKLVGFSEGKKHREDSSDGFFGNKKREGNTFGGSRRNARGWFGEAFGDGSDLANGSRRRKRGETESSFGGKRKGRVVRAEERGSTDDSRKRSAKNSGKNREIRSKTIKRTEKFEDS